MENSMSIIEQSFAALRKKVLPAVLDQSSFKNGQILKAYLDSKGYDVASMTDPDALTSLLYEACVAETARLSWTIKPAKLKKFDDKGLYKASSAGSEATFADKVRKAADAATNKKAEDAAEKATMGMIASLRLDSARKTEDFQAKLRARVERFRKSGYKWESVERDIRNKTNELYATSERENEYVGVYRNLLSEVEV
jgi:hypothetical protein